MCESVFKIMNNDNQNLSWEDAVIEVLKSANGAMHYTDIADQIIERRLRKSFGATPSASVSTTIHNSLRADKNQSPFVKVSRGEFILKASSKILGVDPVTSLPTDEIDEPEESLGIIQAFGMFWRREMVPWKKEPELLGEQQQGTTPVDFCHQRGIYLLQDGREIIYVGRTTDQALGTRLFQHTYDRLSTRWDRFSWFGLHRVTTEGHLEEPDF